MRLMFARALGSMTTAPAGAPALSLQADVKQDRHTMTSKLRLAFASTIALVAGMGCAVANEVTLRAPDGSLDLTGELLSFEDNVYEVRTILGSIRVRADRVECEGAACPTDGQDTIGTEVQLRAKDGSIDLTGEIVEFDGVTYKLQTPFGVLDIDAATSECFGAACPNVRRTALDFGIASSGQLANGLMANLMAGFSVHKSANVAFTGSEAGSTYTLSNDGATLAEVTITAQSSTAAIDAMIAGSVDLAATTRGALADEQTALIGDNADDFTRAESEAVIAIDALAIVVHPSNPLHALSQPDIARIFSGEVTDWAELGGTPGPITLYGRGASSGTGAVFDDLVLTPASASIAPSASVFASDAEVATAVMGNRGGIGFTSFSTQGEAKALDVRGVCGIQTPVSEFTIKTEEYPLTRRLYLYQQIDNIPEVAAEFVDYVTSSEAQGIVNAAGYVDQRVTRVGINDQGLRFVASILPSDSEATFEDLQSMIVDLVAADRLSLTYRFDQTGARLDTRALADVERMAEMIRSNAFEGQEIMVVGFTDTSGEGVTNRELSLARAEQVMGSILQAAGDDVTDDLKISARGYGELSPLVCNSTAESRAINRRVEIWTRDLVASPNG